MDIDESYIDDYGFKEFVSENVKKVVDELISRFGVATVAMKYKEIRLMFDEELNKYLN